MIEVLVITNGLRHYVKLADWKKYSKQIQPESTKTEKTIVKRSSKPTEQDRK